MACDHEAKLPLALVLDIYFCIVIVAAHHWDSLICPFLTPCLPFFPYLVINLLFDYGDVPDAPPSYGSMFGELAQKYAESDGMADFALKAQGVVERKLRIPDIFFCGVLSGLLGFAVPLTEIIIGIIILYIVYCFIYIM